MIGVWWTCKDGTVTLVDRDAQELMARYTWHRHYKGFVVATYSEGGQKKNVTLHRLIMSAPRGKQVDHANHDRLDNTRANLRVCEQQQNIFNRRMFAKNKTGYKGVFASGNRFQAKIGINGKQIHLGLFRTPGEAAEAYNEAARKYHGEYARLNEIRQTA